MGKRQYFLKGFINGGDGMMIRIKKEGDVADHYKHEECLNWRKRDKIRTFIQIYPQINKHFQMSVYLFISRISSKGNVLFSECKQAFFN